MKASLGPELLRKRFNNDIWETGDRRRLKISEIKTRHMVNIMNLLNNALAKNTYDPELREIAEDYYCRFQLELVLRGGQQRMFKQGGNNG